MYKSIEKIREELGKDDVSTIDINKCFDIISNIEDEFDELKDENSDYEDENRELENDIYELKQQVVYDKKSNPITLDDVFKQEIFEELSKKYNYSKLENLLKENNIL